MEICDPCESADCAYKIDDVVVSDFYTPDYFDLIRSRRRYSFNRSITAPAPGAEGRLSVLAQSRRSARCRCCATSIAIRSRASTHSTGPPPKRRSLREFVDGKLNSMHRLAVASWLHPMFHGGR